ncbi:hypothetical protein NDU88_006824 [Pleurodeles waltl]|uniref:Uncharacterized protein n=1 Tax=Pleurodeles waltl TaxID=8319 RepID=A0AAV7X4X0_PLEWA|nr:hypothetical protein NDU88_006824 [Pleurodeles waltl]
MTGEDGAVLARSAPRHTPGHVRCMSGTTGILLRFSSMMLAAEELGGCGPTPGKAGNKEHVPHSGYSPAL